MDTMRERARCDGRASFSRLVPCLIRWRARVTFLQMYAGYFLLDPNLLLYCLSYRMWYAFGIDYAAVLSENPQHHRDWRQAAEVRFASHEELPS
jgi:hypothetical protein